MSWDLRPSRSSMSRPRVLSVDDEPLILNLIQRLLGLQGFDVVTSNDPASVLGSFHEGAWDVVVTDIHMPAMDGLELLRALRQRQPDLPVVVVTAEGTVDTAIQALREGATGMLVKPFTGEALLTEVRRALSAAQMRYEALQYRYLSPVLDSIALTLSSAIEARNLETAAHCRQLGQMSERMAAELGLDEQEQMTIRIGGYLHDVGKIGIADAVLLKPGRLDDEEMAEMRRHSEIGAAILEVHDAMFEISRIVRHHHERWDGRGYPAGIAGTDIPLGARIIAVADAFHAMTNDRVYRPSMSIDQAWEELRAHKGSQFDPEIVEVFERIVDEHGDLKSIATDRARCREAIEPDGAMPLGSLQARLAMLPYTPLARPATRRVAERRGRDPGSDVLRAADPIVGSEPASDRPDSHSSSNRGASRQVA
jgi:putative two-component system response regulator